MSSKKCKQGEIVRDAYDATRKTTGKSYHVKETCIKDVGLPGKTPASKRIHVKEDIELGEFGYHNLNSTPANARHSALSSAVSTISSKKDMTEHTAAVKVMRHLNLLYVYNKNTQKTLAEKLMRDRNWIGKTYLGKDYAHHL